MAWVGPCLAVVLHVCCPAAAGVESHTGTPFWCSPCDALFTGGESVLAEQGLVQLHGKSLYKLGQDLGGLSPQGPGSMARMLCGCQLC